MKATSQVDFYRSDPKKFAGVVFYPIGTVPFFTSDTIIQPDNPHPVPHVDIAKAMADETYQFLGSLPASFSAAMSAAVNASITIKPARKKNWLDRLQRL